MSLLVSVLFVATDVSILDTKVETTTGSGNNSSNIPADVSHHPAAALILAQRNTDSSPL